MPRCAGRLATPRSLGRWGRPFWQRLNHMLVSLFSPRPRGGLLSIESCRRECLSSRTFKDRAGPAKLSYSFLPFPDSQSPTIPYPTPMPGFYLPSSLSPSFLLRSFLPIPSFLSLSFFLSLSSFLLSLLPLFSFICFCERTYPFFSALTSLLFLSWSNMYPTAYSLYTGAHSLWYTGAHSQRYGYILWFCRCLSDWFLSVNIFGPFFLPFIF